MSLILTRRPGEALLFTGGNLPPRRLYIVAIEGNVVRLAIDAPDEVRVTREELLPEEARRRWWEDRGGRALAVAAVAAMLMLADPIVLVARTF